MECNLLVRPAFRDSCQNSLLPRSEGHGTLLLLQCKSRLQNWQYRLRRQQALRSFLRPIDPISTTEQPVRQSFVARGSSPAHFAGWRCHMQNQAGEAAPMRIQGEER